MGGSILLLFNYNTFEVNNPIQGQYPCEFTDETITYVGTIVLDKATVPAITVCWLEQNSRIPTE